MKKVFVMLWVSHGAILRRIGKDLDVELDIAEDGAQDGKLTPEEIADRITSADASIIYRHNSPVIDQVEEILRDRGADC